MRLPARCLLIAVMALAVCDAARAQRNPPAPPNVVVIIADDLGYGDLASYGHPTIRTPRLDRLAAEGVRLTSYYSGAPACSPARAALLTGRYALKAGLPEVLGPESTRGFRPGERTLGLAFKSAGYQTMAIGKWHVGHSTAVQRPLGQGFDAWFGLPYSNDMMPPWVKTEAPLRLYRDDAALAGAVDQDTLTDRYTEEAVRFIGRTANQGPFLLYLAHSMPHLPIHASSAARGRSTAGLYGDVIEAIDRSTGAVLDALDKAGVARQTVVVFTSDNGPWLNLPARMLQEGVEPWHAGSPGLLRGAKATTYEGGIRVPAIVRWPEVVPAGRVSSGIVTAMDLFVTLTTAAGAAPAADAALDGHDVRAHLAGQDPSPTREFFYLNGRRLEGVRVEAWKLRQAGSDAPELYQLEEDPSERYNRAASEPAVLQRLRARFDAFAATLPAPAP